MRDFFKANPEIIKFLYNRKVAEIERAGSARKEYRPWVYFQKFGPCLSSHLNGVSGADAYWRGGTLSCAVIGALMNLIESKKYTRAKALDRNMVASNTCHEEGCMSMKHVVWEHYLIHRDRGQYPRRCVGYVRVYSRRTGNFLRMRPMCQHSEHRCITVSHRPEYENDS